MPAGKWMNRDKEATLRQLIGNESSSNCSFQFKQQRDVPFNERAFVCNFALSNNREATRSQEQMRMRRYES